MDREFDVVVIGDCNPDIVLSGPDVCPEFDQHEKLVPTGAIVIGGSGSITACACARLGLRTRFVGAVGDDIFGRFMLEQLRVRGVDTSLCPVLPGEATGFSVILSRGADRAILTHAGTIARLGAVHLPVAELARARHAHVSSYFLQPMLASHLPSLVASLHQEGVTVSVDPNWDPEQLWDGGLRSVLGTVDVFLPNAAEASALSGLPEARPAAVLLAQEGALVVVKDGPNGCIAAQRGTVVSHPAFDVMFVDPIGAGDAFDAGFLRGWLEGLPLRECLAYACASGALSTRATGATGALATTEEVRALVTTKTKPS